jgi:hypothetical protein
MMENKDAGSPVSEPGSTTRGLPDNDVLTVDFKPSTPGCRKAGCPDLVENPFTRGQMICGISRRLPLTDEEIRKRCKEYPGPCDGCSHSAIVGCLRPYAEPGDPPGLCKI